MGMNKGIEGGRILTKKTTNASKILYNKYLKGHPLRKIRYKIYKIQATILEKIYRLCEWTIIKIDGEDLNNFKKRDKE